ncbi:MAG: helix-turn-helix transcriptional regulator [Clostridia bacterium]|nr:helix-turn-helix transcriptional regulator [Clostridia bacterium]
MNLYISENIRRLRRAKNITQERLAEHLGISTQAVSKWERGETYPDITLVIPLASYFGVTTDELLGLDAAKNEQLAQQILDDCHRLNAECRWDEAAAVLREGYRDFPNHWRIVVAYMWNLAGGSADNDPGHLLAHRDELESISTRILEECTDDELRLSGLNIKAKLARASGDTEKALEILRKFPSFYDARPQITEQLFAKDTPEFHRQLHLNIFELAGFTVNKILKAIWYTDKPIGEKTAAAEKLIRLLETALDEVGYTPMTKFIGEAYGDLAKFHAWAGNYSASAGYLRKTLEYYGRFDEMMQSDEVIPGIPDGVKENFMDGWYINRSLVHMVWDWYRNNPRFAALREDASFRELLKKYGEDEI